MAKSKKSKAPATGTDKGSGGKRSAAKSAAAAAPASAAISAAPAKTQPRSEPRSEPSKKAAPEQVSARAHQIWIDAGKPQGLALEHWLRAERELSK